MASRLARPALTGDRAGPLCLKKASALFELSDGNQLVVICQCRVNSFNCVIAVSSISFLSNNFGNCVGKYFFCRLENTVTDDSVLHLFQQ